MHNRRASLVFIVALSAPGLAAAQPADLIVTNARIHTVDANRPVVDAMAIRTGRVVATGPVQ